MRILFVHNPSTGADSTDPSADRIVTLLRRNGHIVDRLARTEAGGIAAFVRRARALVTGIHSFRDRLAMRRCIQQRPPDIVHVHNLQPMSSASDLAEAATHGIPIVLHCGDHRLVCPTGQMFSGGGACGKCADGNDWWCFLRNCESNRLRSLATTARNLIVWLRRDLHRNVSAFYTHSEFARQKMIDKGFPLSRVRVVPGMIDRPDRPAERTPGRYVAFAGPLRREWGIRTLLSAVRACPGVPFLATGPDDRTRDFDGSLSANFTLAGSLSDNALEAYYANARFTVIPSIRYENSPGPILETMLAGKPVVCARIGGLPEMVEDGLTGLLFEPGNPQDLAQKIALLWENPEWCRRLGEAGRAKALQEYTPERHYERLMDVYCAAAEVQCESPAQWTPEEIMEGI